MKITPRGLVYERRPFRERLRAARIELAKIALIVRSEIRSRVFEKVLGLVFLTVEPIMMALVFYALTYIILASRTSGTQFMTIYISVVTWRWMSKTVEGSPVLFPSYATILKQTNFPVMSLVLSFMGVEFFNFLISFGVLMLFCAAFGYWPSFAYAALVFPMLAEASIIMFLTAVFSSAGVFVRDLQGFLGSIMAIWFYLSPGIYPVENVPEKYMWLYNLNPFAHILPAYQDIMMRGTVPDIRMLLLITAMASVLAIAAIAVLQHARKNFFSFI
jgi:lipopolysaccharide transport system permease protein